jgi:iron complex outermembrane recepter protein
MGVTTRALSLGVIVSLCGLAEVRAEATGPTTLRMRKRARDAVRVTRVAQEGEPGEAAVEEPAVEEPAPSVEPASTAEPVPDATDNVTATPDLTDEDLALLAEVEAEGEIILITGSTLDRRELTTTAPVTVLDRADLEAMGVTTLGPILQSLPAQANGLNVQLNNGGDGSTRIDLRGLGDRRTLVLLNGRRVMNIGLGANPSFDINTLPLAVVQRVEVLKDGASAVYGSDAIGGVVNVITRRDINDTEVALYTGTSQRGDAINYDLSFVTGHTTPKGSVMVSAGWQHQRPVLAGDRNFSRYDRFYDFTEPDPSKRVGIGGSSATPGGRLNPRSIDYDGDGVPDGIADLCGAGACKPDGMGGWVPFVSPDDLYNYQPSNYLYTPAQRYNAFSTGHYDLTPNTRAFFEMLYSGRRSELMLAPEPYGLIGGLSISGESIYNPLGGTVYDYRRRLVEFGNRRHVHDIDTFRIVTGLAGKIADDARALKGWKWELSYNFGRSTAIETKTGSLIRSRLAAALGPSFVDVDGKPKCGSPGNVIPGCVPLNIMGPPGSITAEQRDYVAYRGIASGLNDQKSALALLGGRVAELPNGGDISLALGGGYRAEAGAFHPDPISVTGDTTDTKFQPTRGSFDVVEGFAELSIVPVSGQPYADWVELSLAARGFRYNTFGSGMTWKAGTLVKIPAGLAVRTTLSTAFRAPAVVELYRGPSENFPATTDPCDTDIDGDGVSDGPLANPVAARRCAEQGVAADAVFGTTQQRSVDRGNPNLDPETARVLTAGLVYEPPPVKGLAFTVDYFRINITEAIQALGARAILANCYTRDEDEACALIARDPVREYAIGQIDDPLTNVGGTFTDGVDFAVALDRRLGDHQLRNRLGGQYLRTYELETASKRLQGVGYYDLGVFPRLRVNLSSAWERDDLRVGFNVRYVGGYKECMGNDCNTPENLQMYSRDVESYLAMDLFTGVTHRSRAGVTRFTMGVNNLTNRTPPTIYDASRVGAADSDVSAYDYIGRYFYLRVAQQF